MYQFSNEYPELMNEERFEEYKKLVEDFFHTHNSSDQIKIDAITFKEDKKLFPYTLNVIFHNGEMIGGTDILPCTKKQMEKFLNHQLSEPELLEEVKNDFKNGRLDYSKCDAIYLVSALVKPGHRRKGLALKARMDSIEKTGIKNPVLFYWAYTEDGRKLNEKLAEQTDLKILCRGD